MAKLDFMRASGIFAGHVMVTGLDGEKLDEFKKLVFQILECTPDDDRTNYMKAFSSDQGDSIVIPLMYDELPLWPASRSTFLGGVSSGLGRVEASLEGVLHSLMGEAYHARERPELLKGSPVEQIVDALKQLNVPIDNPAQFYRDIDDGARRVDTSASRSQPAISR